LIKNASTLVFNGAKWTHSVDQLSHKYSPKCTVWHIKFPKFSEGNTRIPIMGGGDPFPHPLPGRRPPNIEHKSAPMCRSNYCQRVTFNGLLPSAILEGIYKQGSRIFEIEPCWLNCLIAPVSASR